MRAIVTQVLVVHCFPGNHDINTMPYLLERAPSSNRFLDPWLKSLVNYWARKAVSFKSQDRGFNSLADN